jgi:casein kinase 1
VGRTLESLRREMQFSSLTIAMLGEQLVTSFEALHATEFIHRDVKTDNLAISLRNDDPTIYLIDFGAAARFTTNGFHVRYEEDAGFVGNQTFCSLNVLRGIRPSRRDDMESIGYVLLYLIGQSLPWIKINSTDTDIQVRHMKRKLETSAFALCRGLEPEYQQYLDYCRSLRFDERPDYSYMCSLFRRLAVRLGFCGNWEYDWKKVRKTSHSTVSRREKSRLRRGSLDTALIQMVSPNQPTYRCSPERKNRNSDQESTTPFLGRSRTRKEMCVIVTNIPDEEQPPTPIVKPDMNIVHVRKRLQQTEASACC